MTLPSSPAKPKQFPCHSLQALVASRQNDLEKTDTSARYFAASCASVVVPVAVFIAPSLVDLLALCVSALPYIDLHRSSLQVDSFWTAPLWTAATAGHAGGDKRMGCFERKCFDGSQLASVLRVG